MRNRLVLAVVVSAFFIAVARPEVEDVPISKLPASVVNTIRTRFPKATLDEATHDAGTARYSVILKSDGRVYDVWLTADGPIELVEKEITAAELPKPAKAALDKAHPKAAIKSLTEVTRIAQGRDVDGGYHAYLDVPGDRPILVRIDRDGNLTKE
jgi:hypothetical protein